MEIIKTYKTMQIIKIGFKYYVKSLNTGEVYGGWTTKHTAESYARLKEQLKG